ncbi:MAG: LuxR family transcriptional regulator [Spirochaetales bacterium]|nr:MAG: LuxR family transcriptional regulator [Spirochaetales bacterium]
MQHLLPLYLILCVLPGIASLTVLSALAARLKANGLTLYLIAYGCFTVSMLVNLVMFYLGINVSEEISPGIFALLSLNIPFSIVMQTTLPLAVNEVTRPPGKRWIDMAFILTGVIELPLYLTPLVMGYSRETQTIFFGPLYPVVAISQNVLIGYSIGVIIWRRRTIVDLSIRRYILAVGIIIAVFLPAIAFDQLYFRGVDSINAVPITVILSPLFYGVLSLATLYCGVRVLMASPHQVDGTDPESPPAEKASLDIVIRNLAAKSGLSEREMTIIPLIAQGLGNKQIALELNIASKTVGNHIYNIYRKLNISSRYELLALLK